MIHTPSRAARFSQILMDQEGEFCSPCQKKLGPYLNLSFLELFGIRVVSVYKITSTNWIVACLITMGVFRDEEALEHMS